MSHQRTSTEEHVFSAKFGVWMIMASGMQLRQESLRAETLKLLGEGEPPRIEEEVKRPGEYVRKRKRNIVY